MNRRSISMDLCTVHRRLGLELIKDYPNIPDMHHDGILAREECLKVRRWNQLELSDCLARAYSISKCYTHVYLYICVFLYICVIYTRMNQFANGSL